MNVREMFGRRADLRPVPVDRRDAAAACSI